MNIIVFLGGRPNRHTMAIAKKEKSENKQPVFDRPFALAMGPQRAGTSWLDRYLRQRDDICMPADVKEIFFFDRHFERGVGFYQKHFKPSTNDKILMEISTTSFDHDQSPERVFETFGKNILLLCPLRHPIIRSYSLYLHYVRYGIVYGSLEQACKQNPQILQSSRYAENVKRWLQFFDKDQLHIVFQEDLEEDQDKYVHQICDILGLPYMSPPDEVSDRFNTTTYSGSSTIAGVAQRGADILRKYRLYFVINLAKKMGLKTLIFGKENKDAQKKTIPEQDRIWLEEQLKGEVEKLEELIGPIPQWHDVFTEVD